MAQGIWNERCELTYDTTGFVEQMNRAKERAQATRLGNCNRGKPLAAELVNRIRRLRRLSSPMPIKRIARTVGVSKNTVRKVLRFDPLLGEDPK